MSSMLRGKLGGIWLPVQNDIYRRNRIRLFRLFGMEWGREWLRIGLRWVIRISFLRDTTIKLIRKVQLFIEHENNCAELV